MLPAHGYPGFKKYLHFYGHYGTAWQNQTKEFAAFPGAILMTTNCIQRPKDSYKENIFTNGVVGWLGVHHIGGSDFTPVIEKALPMVPSWFEQKAEAILLTLLHLGIRNIRLGPSLPAFISENVLTNLGKEFNIMPISTPEEDLQAILG